MESLHLVCAVRVCVLLQIANYIKERSAATIGAAHADKSFINVGALFKATPGTTPTFTLCNAANSIFRMSSRRRTRGDSIIRITDPL